MVDDIDIILIIEQNFLQLAPFVEPIEPNLEQAICQYSSELHLKLD